MYELALSYLKKGWSVIPCGKNKIPLIPWKPYQTEMATPEDIKKWIETYPDAQIGIVTGKISNLTVVDIEKGGDPSFLPQETMIVETGSGGYHYYFKYDEGMTNKARIKELVDIRSEGGYVVAAGSESEKGKYTLLQVGVISKFPKELFPEKVDIFSYPSGGSSNFSQGNQLSKPVADYAGFGKGQRNDEMARYVGHVLAQVHPADWENKAWDIITSANQKNTPPLSQNELKMTFESIKRTERRNHPFGRPSSVVFAQNSSSTGHSQDDPLILGGEDDVIKHIAEVAEEQSINEDDVYPLQMPCFDDVINGGVSPGDVITIAGMSGHGKTTLVQDWTMSMVRGEKKAKALWFSYEVLPTHLWKKFREMGMTREDCAFIPAKHSTGNVAWVENKIKEGKEKFGIKTVFIDHLGFLMPKTSGILGKNLSSNYASFLTQVMRDLKSIALQEEVIIFLPVHMKKVDSRNRNSDIDDIKDSSGIGQESDLVFLIEREKNKEKDANSYFTDKTKITLAKNRKTGATVVADFNMVNGRFAYDNTNDILEDEFKKFGEVIEEKKEEEVKTKEIPVLYYNHDYDDVEEEKDYVRDEVIEVEPADVSWGDDK